jgi:Zn-dependent M32 family carboxypeptidase
MSDRIEIFSTTALTDLKMMLETKPAMTQEQKNNLYEAIIDLIDEFEKYLLEETIGAFVNEMTDAVEKLEEEIEQSQHEEKETYFADTKCDFLKITRPVDERYDDD